MALSGNLIRSWSLPNYGLPYIIWSPINTEANDVHLSFASGAMVRLDYNPGIVIDRDGSTLDASGVTFYVTTPAYGINYGGAVGGTLDGCTLDGVYLTCAGSSAPVLMGCSFVGTTTAISVSQAASPIVSHCDLIAAAFGISNTGTATVMAENNWWGSPTGPRHFTNPGGTGSPVSDNVDFEPWLTAPGDGTPEFESVLAAFDARAYRCGEMATVVVDIKSGWASGSYQVAATIQPIGLDPVPMDPQTVDLSPGATAHSTFPWAIPWDCGARYLSIIVSVAPGGFMSSFPLAATTTAVPQEEIDAAIARARACGSQAACEEDIIASIPFIGLVTCIAQATDEECLIKRYRDSGHPNSAAALRYLQATHSSSCGIKIVKTSTAAAMRAMGLTVASKVLTVPAIVAGWVTCGNYLQEWWGPPAGSLQGIELGANSGDFVPAFIDTMRSLQSVDSVGVHFSDIVVVQGDMHLTVKADSSYATTDSTGLVGTVIEPLPLHGSSYACIPEEVASFLHDSANPENRSKIVGVADSSGVFMFGLAHLGTDDAVRAIGYPSVHLPEGAVASLELSRDMSDFAIRLDIDADGAEDSLIVPLEASDVAEPPAPLEVPSSVGRLTAKPNPFTRSTILSFDVRGRPREARVGIWDTSGRRVREIDLGTLAPGIHQIIWDGSSRGGEPLPAGMYFYRVTHSEGWSGPKKAVLLR